ncbi:GIY-YIG nuclease family protein [Chitinibacter bivalviorum]|uniref:GIY-YIG nuclease family protein n=1 Tax=Chitinibacter bivalviorum TaxID=2739434 RepID=A0A7H9BMY0_9NEIS|nr:GIY-YIG nuclease family protein [Chitinibacter bivalviorum]QLG89578.1 GIY-YIG nuclease family protein [Chitinibacter bivalviorum]
MSELNKLKAAGFVKAGEWVRDSHGKLKASFSMHGEHVRALYAFVIDEKVMYVGKTSRELNERMANYRNAEGRLNSTQVTNVRNSARIADALAACKRVEIYVFAAPDMSYGGFVLDLAAGLEDNIVKTLNPDWNGRRTINQ